jgi:serine/threonine protein kinase
MAEAERVMTEPPPVPESATPAPTSASASHVAASVAEPETTGDAGEQDEAAGEAPAPPGAAAAAEVGGPSKSVVAPSEIVDPLLGKVIDGRFRILSLLAKGGMGRVYRAEQVQLGRICAVKVLHPKYTGDRDPEFARRFFLEARIASQLTHPNTVTIFDYGQDKEEDIFFMAMELLEGSTLHRAIRTDAPFPPERVAYIGRQLCRSLREAHRLGVIHRDLKPANVILTVHGDEPDFVKVLDFGLVKQIEGAIEELTQTGLFMGSPKYMAPEAIRGDPVDGRADIYSLGVMMYEMTCGKVPFEKANSLGTLMAHVNDAPPPMESMCPGLTVPPELSEAIFACLAKDPEDRLATMEDVLLALKRVGGHTGEYRSGMTGTPPAVVRSDPAHGSGHMSSRPPPSASGAQSARPSSLSAAPAPLESIFDDAAGSQAAATQLVEPPLDANGEHEVNRPSGSMRARPTLPSTSRIGSSLPPPLPTGRSTSTSSVPAAPTVPSLPPTPDSTEDVGDDPFEPSASGVSGGTRASTVSLASFRPHLPAPPERSSALWGIAGGAAVVLAVAVVMWLRGDSRPRAGSLEAQAMTTPAVRSVERLPLAPSGTGTGAGASAGPASVTFRVTSEPAGAQVREDGVELCTATPCDLLFRGDAAATGHAHHLTVMRAGYRTETLTVHPEEATATVHLTYARGAYVPAAPPAPAVAAAAAQAQGAAPATQPPPVVQPPPAAPAPQAAAQKSATPKPPAPSSTGFKELPY